MKTYKILYNQICTFENIHLAYLKARKGKRYRPDVLLFNANLEDNLTDIHNDLVNLTFIPSHYRKITIHEPKTRDIRIVPFRDRVIHHSIHNIINPIFDRGFIYDSYACRQGKGLHKAVDRLNAFMKKANTEYTLWGDVTKYFDNIDHQILSRELNHKIGDIPTLEILRRIIGSHNLSDSNKDGRGIPIGNLTSQLFANIFGNILDSFVKNKLRVKYYLRYMDNFVILGHNKQILTRLLAQINEFMGTIKLQLNPKTRIFPSKLGIPFLGFMVFKDHKLVVSQNVKRGRKRVKNLIKLGKEGRISREYFIDSLRSWFAFLEKADTYRLRQKIVAEIKTA